MTWLKRTTEMIAEKVFYELISRNAISVLADVATCTNDYHKYYRPPSRKDKNKARELKDLGFIYECTDSSNLYKLTETGQEMINRLKDACSIELHQCCICNKITCRSIDGTYVCDECNKPFLEGMKKAIEGQPKEEVCP